MQRDELKKVENEIYEKIMKLKKDKLKPEYIIVGKKEYKLLLAQLIEVTPNYISKSVNLDSYRGIKVILVPDDSYLSVTSNNKSSILKNN